MKLTHPGGDRNGPTELKRYPRRKTSTPTPFLPNARPRIDDPRFRWAVERIHNLGVRPLAELLAELDHEEYTPFSFWEDQDFYLQMLVEKIDLKGRPPHN